MQEKIWAWRVGASLRLLCPSHDHAPRTEITRNLKVAYLTHFKIRANPSIDTVGLACLALGAVPG